MLTPFFATFRPHLQLPFIDESSKSTSTVLVRTDTLVLYYPHCTSTSTGSVCYVDRQRHGTKAAQRPDWDDGAAVRRAHSRYSCTYPWQPSNRLFPGNSRQICQYRNRRIRCSSAECRLAVSRLQGPLTIRWCCTPNSSGSAETGTSLAWQRREHAQGRRNKEAAGTGATPSS